MKGNSSGSMNVPSVNVVGIRAYQTNLTGIPSMLIKTQLDATVCRYLFTAKSLYMFRVSHHPSSGVLKTVTAASGTGHNTGTATYLQRGLIRPRWKKVAVPEAVCSQNLTIGALSRRSASSVLVGALFKYFGLFLNTTRPNSCLVL